MNKQLKFGIILQYTQMILSALISLIYTPIMLKILGTSEYGLYNLSSSIISYLSLLSLGFGASYLKFYSSAKQKNKDEIANLNALYLITFSIIAIIALGIFLFIIFNRGYHYYEQRMIKEAKKYVQRNHLKTHEWRRTAFQISGQQLNGLSI